MFEIILNTALLCLVLVGAVSLMHTVALKMTLPSRSRSLTLIMPVSSRDEELELALRSVKLRTQIYGERFCENVIILDCGLDEESRKICEAICMDSDSMTVCRRDELPELLSKSDLQN